MTTETAQEVTTKEERLKKVNKLGWLLPVCLALAALFFVTGASEYTSRTDFCRSCHEMNTVISTWQGSTHGTNNLGIVAECKDCHIPRSVGSMLVTKAGKLTELYVHTLVRPSEFEFKRMSPELADRARSKIQDDNCLACHNLSQQLPQNQTQQIAHSTAVGTASCVSCHTRVGHRPRTNEGEGVVR